MDLGTVKLKSNLKTAQDLHVHGFSLAFLHNYCKQENIIK